MAASTHKSILSMGRKVTIDSRRFSVEAFIASGGSGDVYQVKENGRDFALKLFYPYYQLGLFASAASKAANLDEITSFQRREYEFLSKLSHPNIVRVHLVGQLTLHEREKKRLQVDLDGPLPVLLTDFVDGLPLSEAIREFELSAETISLILQKFAKSLEYLHAEREYLHTDIKSGNILIRRSDHEPILIDFALCKNLNFAEVSAGDDTILYGDWDLFPKDLGTEHRLKILKERLGSRRDLKKLAFPALDLFQVGKMLGAILSDVTDLFENRELAYLEELRDQLTNWARVEKWGPHDLAPKLARLTPEHFTAFGVPELTTPSAAERAIVIPPATSVPLTKRSQAIIENRSWRRLTLINQLCLLSLVYPGADYKRSVHVLYAYDLARQFALSLFSSPTFRSLFDTAATQQLLACALLHDINHFPFLHIFQESRIPGIDDVDVLDLFCDGGITGEKALGEASLYDLLGDIGVNRARFRTILFEPVSAQASEVDSVIKSVIDSGVDVDKLSYLHLDSYFTGVSYGSGIDFACLLRGATVAIPPGGTGPHLAFTDDTIQALESVVMTRFWNFRSLYWHHTNRALMAMILRVVQRVYGRGGRDFRDYLIESKWMGDVEALRYLDRAYKGLFNVDSALRGLPEDRTRVYRRLYTVRAGMSDTRDNELFENVRKLDVNQEISLSREIGGRLGKMLGSLDDGPDQIGEDEILVDIPRREIDSGGPVYVRSQGGTQALAELSEPVRSIHRNYDRLTKRIRFFVSPRVRSALVSRFGEGYRERCRAELASLLVEAVGAVSGAPQVR